MFQSCYISTTKGTIQNSEPDGGAVGSHCDTSRKVGVQFSMVYLEFFIDLILTAALWSWGRLSLYCYLQGKGGRYVGLTLPATFVCRLS